MQSLSIILGCWTLAIVCWGGAVWLGKLSVRRLGLYTLDGARLTVDGTRLRLDEPHFASIGQSGTFLFVRIAQGDAAETLLLDMPENASDRELLEMEPAATTWRRIEARYGAELVVADLMTEGDEDLAAEVLRSLAEHRGQNSMHRARERLPRPRRAPEPEIDVALQIEIEPDAKAEAQSPYRSSRPSPRDGARFVADMRSRAHSLGGGVYADEDYVMHVRGGSALVLPRGRCKAIAADDLVRITARDQRGEVLSAEIPLADAGLAHALADDLDDAWQAREAAG